MKNLEEVSDSFTWSIFCLGPPIERKYRLFNGKNVLELYTYKCNFSLKGEIKAILISKYDRDKDILIKLQKVFFFFFF
jgi:hypothetical protein